MDAIEASLNELKFALRLRGEREVAAQELGKPGHGCAAGAG